MMRSSTATPAPRIMPHSRCLCGKPWQAMAMTSALSPDSRTLIHMILTSATQNWVLPISLQPLLTMASQAAGSIIWAIECTWSPLFGITRLADDFILRKELRDLASRGVGRVGTVHGILADRLGVHLADGAGRGLGRVGGTHELAVARDSVVALEHLHQHRPRHHEIHQFAEKRPLAMDGVEFARLRQRDAHALLRDDAQAGLFDHGVDGAGQIARGRMGFQDRKGALERHRVILY